MNTRLAVIAIGGNSLIKDKEHQRVEDQYDAICETAECIVDIIQKGYEVVLTHGNGPQVGFILRRSEIAYKHEGLHFVPLVSCVADTQGALGYQIQQALGNEFKKRKISKKAVTIITRVEVDRDDPSFFNPSKPIGSFYSEEQAQNLQKDHPDWVLIHDAGRGYRRAVPSPMPIKIIELEAIETLINQGFCVVSVGGGGIPVTRRPDEVLEGVDAVIDKDFATSLLASNLQAPLFIISTAVEQVALNFGTPSEKPLGAVTAAEMEQYLDEGQFAPGSMAPKVQAAIDFLKRGGSEVIITNPENIGEAVMNDKGTHIVP
jgi:carbamate kinase